MKIKNAYPLIFMILLIAGCSDQIRIKTDYDREVNLKLYKSYAWLPVKEIESKNNPLVYNELTDKRIKKAVEVQFQIKGIQYTPENPDLRIHYHIIVDNRSAVRPAAYGYYYSPYWMRNQYDVYQYREGTLIIDLMDAKNNNLIWRGWGTEVLNTNDIDLTEAEINDAVYKILKEFPPTKN
jgi:Domain of unknown function (DUF4136)